jgi:hypothetical protein
VLVGDVIEFPVGRVNRTCFNCLFYSLYEIESDDEQQAWCENLDEEIDSEIEAAKECPEYEAVLE